MLPKESIYFLLVAAIILGRFLPLLLPTVPKGSLNILGFVHLMIAKYRQAFRCSQGLTLSSLFFICYIVTSTFQALPRKYHF